MSITQMNQRLLKKPLGNMSEPISRSPMLVSSVSRSSMEEEELKDSALSMITKTQ